MSATSAAKKSAPASKLIEDFESLPIKEILPLLKTLSSRDLKAVAAIEKAGKNRVTLLRAVRKIELAREAAAPKRPAKKRLTVVDDEIVAPPAVVSAPAVEVAPEPEVPEPVAVIDLDPEPKPVKAPSAKKPRPRPVVKSATWEEEVQPQLPKRFLSSTSGFDIDLDPPTIALVPSDPEPGLTPAPAKASKGASTISFSRPFQAAKKFENVALVMAAILAVLLGLAIGTVLARSGGTSDAGPAPTSVTSQAAAAPTAG